MLEDLGNDILLVLFGGVLILGVYLSENIDNDRPSNSDLTKEEFLYEGGEPEEDNLRSWLFNRLGRFIPTIRTYFTNILLYGLDPDDYQINVVRFSNIQSHFDGFDEIIKLMRRMFERSFSSIMNNAFAISALYYSWYMYARSTEEVRRNRFLMNNAMYMRYLHTYRRVTRSFANIAGVPLGTVESLYRIYRRFIALVRRLR